MQIVDLSHKISNDMPVYPGSKKHNIEQINTVKKDGYAQTHFNIYSHIGTHIDAPAHMLENAKWLNDFPIHDFIGHGLVIDCTNLKNNLIEIETLRHYARELMQVDYALLYTGWDKFWGSEKYLIDLPALSEDAAEYISEFQLKGIGVDTISVDKVESENLSVHKILMKTETLIIENLTNLKYLINKDFIFHCAPLSYDLADGSPIRAFAIIAS